LTHGKIPLVKDKEMNLKPDEALVYRDFVNQYNEKGISFPVDNLIYFLI
jgi:hypothetical protein